MKLVKSLVLASAAAFVGMTGAQAADLPLAEPVEYVKICDTYGAGFFYIPGSDTCLLIGGYVRADYSAGEVSENRFTGVKPSNNTGFRARARLWFDARTETEYGTLRSYVRLQFQRDSGGTGGVATSRTDGDDALFDKAFVQFAGITAGLADSFWDFKPYPTFTNPFISDRTLAVLAYTADFGGGFTATAGIEDGTARRGQYGAVGAANGFGPLQESNYGPQKFPDFVGNLRVSQGWGEAQLSGYARQLTTSLSNDKEWAFGGQLGAKILLPFLAKGDYIWATGAYSQGALSYLGIGNGSSDYGFTAGGVQNIIAANRQSDFEVGANGNIRKTDAYAFNLGVLHYWTPKWRSAFQGTYVNADIKTPGEDNDFAAYGLTANLIWTPVKKLDIGAEINYLKVTNKSDRYNLRDDDAFVGRMRIQRDF